MAHSRSITLLAAGLLLTLSSLISCTPKPKPGFGLANSPFRFIQKNFEDPAVLAEVNGQIFKKDQILDKSPVLRDLDGQEKQAIAALAYMKVQQQFQGETLKGVIEINLADPKIPLPQLLARFGKEPQEGLTVSYKISEDPNLVAKFKDFEVTFDHIDRNHAVMQAMEQRKFEEIVAQLTGQLARILINEQALKQKIDLQEFINQNIFKGQNFDVNDTELFAYTDKIGLSREEVKGELMDRMRESLRLRKQQEALEKYAAENIVKEPIAVSFNQPSTNLKLDDSWRPIAGYKDAPIALVAFSSPNCPDCIDLIKNISGILKKYDGHLKLNWIYTFGSSDGIAQMLSKGALCMDAVKKGEAIAFLNEFAPRADQVDENTFFDWAASRGTDREALKTCFQAGQSDSIVTQHLDYAQKVGIVANPTLWIEGKTVQGVITTGQLETLVQDEIQTKGSTWWGALWRRLKARFTKD